MTKIKAIGKFGAAIAKISGATMLKCKKASPEIMLVAGIVAGVAAIVTAVAATKKADDDDQIRDIDADLEAIEKELKNATDKEGRKVLRGKAFKCYIRLAKRLLKHYAVPIVLTILSILLVLGSHGILKTRYVQTAAAYTALDASFKDYRKRIRDIAGEDAEQRFYDGTDEIEVKVLDENGKKTKKTVQKRKEGLIKRDSPYEFDFNKITAPLDATTDLDTNFATIRYAQSWANDKLNAQGHLFLHEVLDELGIERTTESMVVGWRKHGDGDGYVDFGVSEYYTDAISDILDGNLPNIHLNFNCDGLILENFNE